MTKLVFTLVVLAIGASAVPARAEVQYPWCAEYRRYVGGTNCGFVTYQQCLATISGIGGYCYRNPAYPPPRQRSRQR
jgi:hypothetical protein